jgi:hypothetical protein
MEEMGGANMVTYYMSVLFLQMGLSHFMVSRAGNGLYHEINIVSMNDS